MALTIKLDIKNEKIIVGSAFYKKALNTRSGEYAELARVKQTCPDYTVVVHTINQKSRERYEGLTYGYMVSYIRSHEPKENVSEVLDEFDNLQQIASCHSRGKRYHGIKEWFLSRYPEIAQFGIQELEIPIEKYRPKSNANRSNDRPELKPAA